MNSFLIDYTAYMRSLATRHRELHHTTTEKHFFRGELEEFWKQFRSEVCFPCLMVEGSDNEYSGREHNLTKKRNTSFIVADSYDQHDDYDEIQLKMSRCEEIAEQIMGRIIMDEDATIFQKVEIESITGQYLQNTTNRYVGYRISFSGITPSCFFSPNAFTNETD